MPGESRGSRMEDLDFLKGKAMKNLHDKHMLSEISSVFGSSAIIIMISPI
jgi:hypothetical protein